MPCSHNRHKTGICKCAFFKKEDETIRRRISVSFCHVVNDRLGWQQGVCYASFKRAAAESLSGTGACQITVGSHLTSHSLFYPSVCCLSLLRHSSFFCLLSVCQYQRSTSHFTTQKKTHKSGDVLISKWLDVPVPPTQVLEKHWTGICVRDALRVFLEFHQRQIFKMAAMNDCVPQCESSGESGCAGSEIRVFDRIS